MSTANGNIIYFDNAATTWPKPPSVARAMIQYMEEIGANPGRSAHRMANAAGRILYNTRAKLAGFFNAPDETSLIFTQNVTEAINVAIRGLLKPGDHVITSSIEHNAVMRPLRHQENDGCTVSILQCSPQGELDPNDIKKMIRPKTKLLALNHMSNVTGAILPIREMGEICREHDILLLADAAQSAGCIPIDMQKDNIDILAFTGHKALLGPTGTGGLILGPRVPVTELNPLLFGGTGSLSALEIQPDFLPDKLESGTRNMVGIAGLQASLNFISNTGLQAILQHKQFLTTAFLNGLKEIKNCEIYGTDETIRQSSVVSFNLKDFSCAELGEILDTKYNILCRVGLHCSPAAHRTIKTFPAGTVRFSFGYFNTMEHIRDALAAINQIIRLRDKK